VVADRQRERVPAQVDDVVLVVRVGIVDGVDQIRSTTEVG